MKNQIILQILGRANEQVIINNNGIFQKNVSDVSTQKSHNQKKKVYDYNNLSFKLSQVKSIPEIKDFNFVVSMSQIKKISVLKCEVKGKNELQRLFRFIGKFVFIKGLEGIIEDSYKIGQGSFSKIYLINTIYGERFALKTFDKKATNGKTYKTFLNQLKIMRTLSNPYLLSSEYVFQTQKYYYIKLQYLKNTLKTIIRKKMTIKQQKSTMRQLLEGLVQMSRHNIIHRDLKPENIMIRELPNDQWQCVIIDFGLGVIASQRPYLYSRCGTPGFISPEIANLVNKQQMQSVRSDIFSLGCIFYNMLIGQYLFNGKNANDILLNNRKLNYSTYHFNKMSFNERDLLEKMLAKDPSTRIKPQQALKHPYLISEIDDQDQIPDQQNMLSIKMKKLNKMFIIKNMETIISTSITMHENSLNQNSCNSSYSHVKYSKIKDSCATFDLQIKASSHADNHDDFIIGLSFQEDSNNQKERSHSKGKKTLKQSNFKPKKRKFVDKQQTE